MHQGVEMEQVRSWESFGVKKKDNGYGLGMGVVGGRGGGGKGGGERVMSRTMVHVSSTFGLSWNIG